MTLKETLSLLERAKIRGIEITLDNTNLLVRFPKGIIDDNLINDIKKNKEYIVNYFVKLNQNAENSKKIKQYKGEDIGLQFDNEVYYHITSTQEYWVNDEIDKEYKKIDKIHGSVFIKYHISGFIDLDLFAKAYQYIINRHESLRSTFHLLGSIHMMKIQDAYLNNCSLEVIDIRDTLHSQSFLENFKGHQFNFAIGPLIVARLIYTGDLNYILSIKVHHIIFDSWSEEILIRDLLASYIALKENRLPILPNLEFQTKDFFKFINDSYQTEYENNRRYWQSLYSNVPDEIHLPGASRNKSELFNKICKSEVFFLQGDLISKLATYARIFDVSLFVILQASFKSFLNHTTGNNDIVIGTYVFGRDYHGVEDQIGCFAKTALIRTLIGDNDTFTDTILNVKKSNEDMHFYKHFSLMDYFYELLYPSKQLWGSFWKINMQYSDYNKSYFRKVNSEDIRNDNLGLKITSGDQITNSYIAIDMQLNFKYYNQTVNLTVEFDSSVFTGLTIRCLIQDYITYINKLHLQ